MLTSNFFRVKFEPGKFNVLMVSFAGEANNSSAKSKNRLMHAVVEGKFGLTELKVKLNEVKAQNRSMKEQLQNHPDSNEQRI
eukprot:SAG31_NODE_7363_length_1709_cov_1.850932_2_plen_82_part_00